MRQSKFKKTYKTVFDLLTSNVKYRDSDEKLCAKIWSEEYVNHKSRSAYDFLCAYAEKRITPADHITRARRKVQEHHESLRGKSYKKRKGEKQEEVKEEIRQLSERNLNYTNNEFESRSSYHIQ